MGNTKENFHIINNILLFLITTFSLQWIYPVSGDTNNKLDAQIAYGSFENPGAVVRPRFRYWLPDAGVNESIVQENIQSAGSIGAGGVEFLPYYSYGGQIPYLGPGPDWVTYGFGTDAFRRMFIAALEAHRDNGLVMDFALGPNQGQGVPARTDDDGLQWDLAPFSVLVSANGSFSGVVPGWKTGELIALVSAEVLSTQNLSLPASSVPSTEQDQTSYSKMVLRSGSLKNHVNAVSVDGIAQLQLPTNASYQLFAFYQYRTLNKNLRVEVKPSSTIFDNGSYIVDHFSSRGASTVIKFWETQILNPEIRQLIREVGNYAWEDSIEATCNMSWTPSLPELFVAKHGYDLTTFLPLVMFGNNNMIQTSPGLIECVLDTPDHGEGFVNDYRDTLVLGYRQYLETLTAWTNSELGIQMSAQVSYNLPMDMEANVPFVNAPECESLQFGNNVDGYRQFVGPSALAGKRVVSNEMGAEMLQAYRMPISRLLWSIHRAVVAGVNQVVLHGQDYTGNYYGTTWPGYSSFAYLFSGQYSEKDPVWYHGFAEVLNYTARVQFTQQTSQLMTDLAIYNKVSATNDSFPTIYTSDDLVNYGYTYNYLSPENFALPQATVADGLLAPTGPAYKALLITQNSKLSSDGIRAVQKYAQQGLPVIVSGEPDYYISSTGDSINEIQAALSALKTTTNVYSIAAGDITQQLVSLGLLPDVQIRANGTWYPTWRRNEANDTFYCFIFNDSNNSTVGTIEVPTKETPYIMNAWTGQQTPLLLYQIVGNHTRIPLRLEANQTALFTFTDHSTGDHLPDVHVTQFPSTVIGSQWNGDSSSIQIHISAGSWDSDIHLSDGRTYGIHCVGSPAEPFLITGWTLVVEHWEAPTNISDAAVTAVKHNTTHMLPALVSWTEIPSLTNTSGVGYYTASFVWPPAGNATADGAYIRLPPIAHAARLYVNGQKLDPLDPASPQADISNYLRNNEVNTVLVEVPSLMWNYLRSIIGELTTMEVPASLVMDALGGPPGLVENGLIGDVQIVPYVAIDV